MEKLKERHTADVHARALGVLWIGLSGNPKTEALAPEAQASRAEIKTKHEDHEEALMRRMAATARVEYADALLDGRVRQLSLDVLAAVGGKRDHQTYASLFTQPPSVAMQDLATPEQGRYVAHLIATLKTGGAYEPFAAHIPLLEQGQQGVDDALKAREQRYVEEARAQTALNVACEDGRRLYNGFHARLSVLFPEQDALVESFFANL